MELFGEQDAEYVDQIISDGVLIFNKKFKDKDGNLKIFKTYQ